MAQEGVHSPTISAGKFGMKLFGGRAVVGLISQSTFAFAAIGSMYIIHCIKEV